jgi:hypothetical protein
MWSAIIAFFAGLVGKLLGGFISPQQNAGQQAVNVEEKMADAEVNSPDKERVIKELDNGTI